MAPVVALLGSGASSLVAALVFSGSPLGAVAIAGIGVASYAAYLAAGLWLFLPDDVPRWSTPVAVVASTLSAAAGAVGGVFAATALMPALQQPGNDCFGCGPQALLFFVLPVAFGTAGGVGANAVVVNVADATRQQGE